jgi:hypothetical protein
MLTWPTNSPGVGLISLRPLSSYTQSCLVRGTQSGISYHHQLPKWFYVEGMHVMHANAISFLFKF